MHKKIIQNFIYSSIQKKIKDRKYNTSAPLTDFAKLFPSSDATIYIHFPFCDIACNYCRFRKNIDKNLIDEYCESLLKEIDLIHEAGEQKKQKISSVYFGGGTPSLMPVHYIKKIITRLKDVFETEHDIQITLECHPQSLHENSVSEFLAAGVTRLSIGVQSFKEDVLKEMGRPIDAGYIKKILTSIKSRNFHNYNVDLIYGFDCQDLHSFLDDIQRAIDYGAGHITMYPLIKTSKNDSVLMTKKQVLMYNAAQALLLKNGYHQYSVEDFSLKDEYKLNYQIDAWGMPSKDHIFIGTSVFGTLNNHFFQKEKSVRKYIDQVNNKKFPIIFLKRIDSKQAHFIRFILGLHYLNVDRIAYKEKYGVDFVREWKGVLWLMSFAGMIHISKKEVTLNKNQYFRASQLWGKILYEVL